MFTTHAIELFSTRVQVEVDEIGITAWLKQELLKPVPVAEKKSVPLFVKQQKSHDQRFQDFMDDYKRQKIAA